MVPVDLPIDDRKKPPAPKFPDGCIQCGGVKSTILPLKLNMGVQSRGRGVMMELPVPLCEACAAKERRVAGLTLVPFTIAGLIFFALGFVPGWLFSPEGSTPETLGFPVAAGVLTGLISGVLGGSLVEFFVKMAFSPAYGRLLMRRPMTVLSLFDDSEDVIGLSARFGPEKKVLRLSFENEEMAGAFRRINNLE